MLRSPRSYGYTGRRNASDGTLKMRMLCTDFDEKQPSMYGAQLTLLPGKKIELVIEPMDQQ